MKYESSSTLIYWPVCKEWQKLKCKQLGLRFVNVNLSHIQEPYDISVFSEPAAKGRIKGDGNCFFRALAFLITGSQDDHNELRLLTTTYMSHQAASLSCYLKESESMKSNLE